MNLGLRCVCLFVLSLLCLNDYFVICFVFVLVVYWIWFELIVVCNDLKCFLVGRVLLFDFVFVVCGYEFSGGLGIYFGCLGFDLLWTFMCLLVLFLSWFCRLVFVCCFTLYWLLLGFVGDWAFLLISLRFVVALLFVVLIFVCLSYICIFCLYWLICSGCFRLILSTDLVL